MNGFELAAVVLATLLGPIAAVQAQKFIERSTETRNRKRYIFYTLMATRAVRLATEHVAALNSIELDFRSRRDRRVIDAWRQYSDHLNVPGDLDGAHAATWADRRDVLFFELFFEMSQALGYSFDRVQLRRGVYYPRGHGDNEVAQSKIREGVLKILSGEEAIPMNIVRVPINEEALKLQLQLQKAIVDCIEGKGELRVSVAQTAEN